MYGNRENNGNHRRKRNVEDSKQSANLSMQDLFKNKNLELIVAALLLSGKLKVDSVELFRVEPVVAVSLLGEYLQPEKDNTNTLAAFLEENGEITLDDVFDALQQRMGKGGK